MSGREMYLTSISLIEAGVHAGEREKEGTKGLYRQRGRVIAIEPWESG